MALSFSDADIMRLGLKYMGFKNERQNGNHKHNLRRFRAAYGTSPSSCAAILEDLQNIEMMGLLVIQKPLAIHLLMTLEWFKHYPSEPLLAGKYGIHEETVRRYLFAYSDAIQHLKKKKVRILTKKITIFIYLRCY
jgi:hypothetical protein